ncbi:MAG: peptidoglycan DD-metalloendopeptidase family protein [Gammaproteobacteria bacterium]|nr:peptidoglycan DD-metalloendopeptidase family protein [Gammaproteobacteria bacterium]
MLPRLIFTLIVLSHSFTLFAKEDSQQKLQNVKTEIQSLNQDVNKNKASKAELFKQLKQQSRTVSNLNKSLLNLEKDIQQQSLKLKRLEQRLQQQQSSHAEQLDALNQQIRTSYIHGQPSYLKILLNQHDPATLSRSSTYFHYFHQARQKQLLNINNTLNNLSDDQKALFTAQKAQQKHYAKQKQKQDALKKQTQQRQATLKRLETKITDQDSRLSFLHEQEKALHSLLDSLNRPTKNTAVNTPVTHTSFSKRAGLLTWPIKGKLLARYGSSRNLGKLTWQGILISTPAGKNIIASAPGQVVFADWLRGFGLLVIIDHGDQYMTLYGNNETLLTTVGDSVNTGDLIAQSGDKGIHQYAGLYFEIRHKGSPTNPLKWLGKKG